MTILRGTTPPVVRRREEVGGAAPVTDPFAGPQGPESPPPVEGPSGRRRARAFTLAQAAVALRAPLVLVAEDDDEMRSCVAAGLESDGYEVMDARDGVELFELLQGREVDRPAGAPPAVVVTDLNMPGLNGLEVMARLRDAGVSAPIIVITGYADDAQFSRARELGAAAVFRKPFDMDDLRTAVLSLTKL
jgi:two-component system response regulator (stage 0 sporulation protein F)